VRKDPGGGVRKDFRRVDDFSFQVHLLPNTITINLFDRMPIYSIQGATSSDKMNAADLTVAAENRILQ
jgi:hypothetical protein